MALAVLPHRFRLAERLAASLRALGRALVQVAEAGPRMEALERLSRESDAALSARGTTRDAEIRRILGVFRQV